jgi:hypothetical protein
MSATQPIVDGVPSGHWVIRTREGIWVEPKTVMRGQLLPAR